MKLKLLYGASLCGAFAVSLNMPFAASVIWGVANPLATYHNITIKQNEQAFYFGICSIIAWIGVVNLW